MSQINFEKVGNRLYKARINSGYTLEFVGSKIGVHKSTISRWEKGETEKIKLPMIESLAKIYNVNPSWLAGINDNPTIQKSFKVESNVFPSLDTVIKIPVVGKISAGIPLLAVENIVSYEYAPSSQIKQGYTYFYLTVQGDSMNLKFHEGDIILVQKQSDLENDEIGVILINGEATVKKYKNENGLIILQPMSTNPEHQVQIYNPKEKDIEIIGKVISYQGKV